MTVTIRVNRLTLSHKGSGGWVRSTLPDVCKSPVVPVPYVNVAYSKTLAKGTKTVHADGGNMISIKGSEYATSTGDEPGVGGGVKSGVNMHRATWLSWSPDVFMEGQPVCRKTDKMLLNRGNTVSIGGDNEIELTGEDIEKKLCDIACKCLAKALKPGQTYQSCVNDEIRKEYYDGRYPKKNSPFHSEMPFDRGSAWDRIDSLNNPGNPTSNFIRPNSRRLDIGIPDGKGGYKKLYDMKFRDDPPVTGQRRDDYESIGKKHAGDEKNYEDFKVDDRCDCGGGNAPETVPAPQPFPVPAVKPNAVPRAVPLRPVLPGLRPVMPSIPLIIPMPVLCGFMPELCGIDPNTA
jgi:Domain of unknown function (DUF4150)